MPVADKIFARVGASDDLASGQSTFMLEMKEVAYILNNDYSNAKKTLAAVTNPDAITSYLKAVLASRTNDTGALKSNLKVRLESGING